MTGNGLRLPEGGDFGAQNCQATINDYSEPKSFCNHVRPAFGKVLLGADLVIKIIQPKQFWEIKIILVY